VKYSPGYFKGERSEGSLVMYKECRRSMPIAHRRYLTVLPVRAQYWP
jgi:hypothetical protein